MKKEIYQVEFGHVKTEVEAINPEEAFIIAVRKSKLRPMSELFRFRIKKDGKHKRPDILWKYQNPLPILKKYNLI